MGDRLLGALGESCRVVPYAGARRDSSVETLWRLAAGEKPVADGEGAPA